MGASGMLTIRTANVSERESAKLAPSGVPAGEYVLCEVTDTGCGIPADKLEKIFEPFYTTKEVGKGTGLGLSTVYGIVQQTGGQIVLESAVGVGTTFRIYLPRHVPAEAEKPAVVKAEKKEKPRDLTGSGTVLLVEDEEAVRAFASRALVSRGYKVVQAVSGVDALDVLKRHDGEIDLVISDVVMPEMDGPALLKRLRAHKPDIKFIFISGYAEDAFKGAITENEQFAFLPKPFSLKQLAAAVKEALTEAG
jgi:two-component system cell cycle sensor histidine kinase/response regulator CckA